MPSDLRFRQNKVSGREDFSAARFIDLFFHTYRVPRASLCHSAHLHLSIGLVWRRVGARLEVS